MNETDRQQQELTEKKESKGARFTLYMLAIIGFTVIYAAYLTSLESIEKHNVGDANVEQVPIVTTDERQILDDIAGYIGTSDLDRCQSIDSEELAVVCVNNIAYDLAIKNSDIKWCSYLDDEMLRVDDCEREILLNNALEQLDTSVCEMASSESVRDDCTTAVLYQKALSEMDKEVCTLIPYEWQRNNCIQEIEQM